MSLINDALKRANQTRKQQPPAVPSGPVMQPQTAPSRSSSLALIVFIAILVVFLAGLGMLLLMRGVQTIQPSMASNPPPKTPVVSNSVVKPTVTSTAVAQPAPVAAARPQPASQPAVVTPRPSKPTVNTSVVVTIPVPGAAAAKSPAAADTPGPTVSSTAEKAPDAAEEIAAQPPPNLKLQGIYFRRTNPSAMINGRNVFVGDEVNGARLVQIDRTSVMIEINGRKQVLHLP
jgi:hypothetical protein